MTDHQRYTKPGDSMNLLAFAAFATMLKVNNGQKKPALVIF
jgi:hypothetical protein